MSTTTTDTPTVDVTFATSTFPDDTTERVVRITSGACDRCGAGPKARFVFPDGRDLVLCGHHANELDMPLYSAGCFADDVFALTHL